MKRYRNIVVLLLAVVVLFPVWVASAHEREATAPRLPQGDPEPLIEELEMQEQRRLTGEFGSALRQNFSSQLEVIGWSDNGNESVVHRVGLSPEQDSRIGAEAQHLGLTTHVVATDLATSEKQQLNDSIRKEVLHSLPPQVGWSIGIDLDTQRIGVAVEGYTRIAELDRKIRGVSESFVTALQLQRAATNKPRLSGVNAADLYSVVDAELAPVDWRDTRHARGGEWLRVPDGVCTSGFLFRSGSSYRLSTAGHCADAGDWDGDIGGSVGFVDEDNKATGTSIGTITHNLFEEGGTDVALMTLSSLATTVSRVTTTANTYRDIIGVKKESDLKHNDQQCFVGWGIHANWNKDKKCGPLKKENITVHPKDSPKGFEIEGLYCLERRTIGGDSGGPVYYEFGSDALAAGTLAYSIKENYIFTTTKWYACYHTVTDIEAATGYSVVTS